VLSKNLGAATSYFRSPWKTAFTGVFRGSLVVVEDRMGRPVAILLSAPVVREPWPIYLQTVSPCCSTEVAAGSKNPRTSAGLVRVPASPLRDANPTNSNYFNSLSC
jgi:hypothetical protein